MSDKELSRVEILRDLLAGRLTVSAAGELMGLERRQVLRLMGEAENKAGPRLTLGHSINFEERAAHEISSTFRSPTVLVDVWFRPLGLAMWSWRRRVRQSPERVRAGAFREERWSDRIESSVSFDEPMEGPRGWLLREGPHRLNWLERELIRFSFRFERLRYERRDLPTPDDIIEELADQLVSQINRTAVTGFEAALNELIEFHKFVLDAQQYAGADGQQLNYAQVGRVSIDLGRLGIA